MSDAPKLGHWQRDELIGLLSVSATLSGLCITGVAFLTSPSSATRAGTLADDILAICAAAFLLCTYLIFWALRSRKPRLSMRLANIADSLFLGSLSVMTAAAFLMVYTIW